MTAMRIAVLGAGGFLGSHLAPALAARFDAAVDAVDVDFAKLVTDDPRITKVLARVEEPHVAAIVGRADVVVSLTALCNPSLYSTSPLAVIDASFTHLTPVVEACARSGVRLVHFSTAEVYGRLAVDGEGNRTREMNEDTSALLLGPVDRERWTYACAKQLLERVIWAHGHHGSLAFTIIRPFNVIGPRMDYVPGVDGEGVPRVLPSFMAALLRGDALELVNGGTQRRSFMAVGDLVEAVCRVVERRDSAKNRIFNVGNPKNDVTVREFARRLAHVYRARVPDAPEPELRTVTAAAFYGEGYDDSTDRVPDIEKARRLLGWEPRASLDDMLPDIVDDYVSRYTPLLERRGAPVAARNAAAAMHEAALAEAE
jgi:UDP-apiose/xylose synthase